MVVLVGIIAIIFSMTQQTSKLWKNTSGKIEGFTNARSAFDAMTRTISQATLNTYYDYADSSGNWVVSSTGTLSGSPPATYARRSDLHFICGQANTPPSGSPTGLLSLTGSWTPITHCIFFQAPLGKSALYSTQQKLLNACGFYLVYGPDPSVPNFLPSSSANRYRYRLMEFLQPSESLTVYSTGAATTRGTSNYHWFTDPIVTTPDANSNFVLAENIIALIIWPKLSKGDQAAGGNLTTNYSYDSEQLGVSYNQLPPIVEVTMVAIDEASALKLGNTSTPPNAALGLTQSGTPLFTTSSESPNQLEADLTTMETQLTASHVNFRVFQTEVAISGAKWTTN